MMLDVRPPDAHTIPLRPSLLANQLDDDDVEESLLCLVVFAPTRPHLANMPKLIELNVLIARRLQTRINGIKVPTKTLLIATPFDTFGSLYINLCQFNIYNEHKRESLIALAKRKHLLETSS